VAISHQPPSLLFTDWLLPDNWTLSLTNQLLHFTSLIWTAGLVSPPYIASGQTQQSLYCCYGWLPSNSLDIVVVFTNHYQAMHVPCNLCIATVLHVAIFCHPAIESYVKIVLGPLSSEISVFILYHGWRGQEGQKPRCEKQKWDMFCSALFSYKPVHYVTKQSVQKVVTECC
jgi:hypothetical protein